MLMLLSNGNFSAMLEYNNVFFTDDVEKQLLEQIKDKIKFKLIPGKSVDRKKENYIKILVYDITTRNILITKKFYLNIKH